MFSTSLGVSNNMSISSTHSSSTTRPIAVLPISLSLFRRLREEKLERRVKKELPVVSKRLRAQITEWETAHGTEFVIGGECMCFGACVRAILREADGRVRARKISTHMTYTCQRFLKPTPAAPPPPPPLLQTFAT